ncbi:MAG: trypsin-like peptidase domain-containing protein [Planctomycetota bacterium]|nr:trypsin-like peptidase domain-containing protein [Planctomycetota bacterium]
MLTISPLSAVLVSALSLAFSVSLSGQGPQPMGLAHPSAGPWQNVARVALPALDRPRIAVEDINREGNGQPARFAIAHDVSISPNTHGTWEELDATWSLWRLRVLCPGASHVNLGFDAFSVPAGGRMQLYSSDGASVVRPFTSDDHQPTGQLWTPIVFGKEVTCEVYLPTAAIPQLQLNMVHVGSGYRFFGAGPTALISNTDGSGSCNIDVNCSQGVGWEGEISAVAAISTGGSIFCTGVMVNNTAQDGRDFFLTANHCGVGPGQAPSLVCYWNYENTSCGGNNAPLNQFTTGSTYRAGWGTSDFTLVELNSTPNASWDVTYAGWNRGAATAPSAVAIHHPSGDAKKISFENQPTTHTSYGGSASNTNGTHVRVADWDLGTTEPGSSGSPLFDNNHRIIGQLHGGSAACGNNLPDWYGRFNRSWTGGGTNSSRLSNWLDPIGSGVQFLDTLSDGAAFLTMGQGCPGSVNAPPVSCPQINPNGGALSNTLRDNEYCYQVTNSQSYAVTGFDIYSGTTTGGSVVCPAQIYLDVGGAPSATPVATTTVTVGAAPGFYTATFSQPVTVSGTYYLGFDTSSNNVYISTLNSGATGVGFWRDVPNGTPSWTQSGLVQRPSWRVACTTAQATLTPRMSASGLPQLGTTYSPVVSDALPATPAVLISGMSDVVYQGQLLPLPLPGAPGCDLLVSADVLATTVTSFAGVAQSSLAIPNQQALIGVEVFHQWAIWDPSVNGLSIAVSNAGKATVGN